MEISELITTIREDYLSDIFEGWENATDAERNDQFLWPDKALLRYISEAQRQACNRSDLLYDDETFSFALIDGNPSYKFDNRITRIEQVSLNSKTVQHLSKIQLQMSYPNWRTDSGIGTNNAQYTVRGYRMRMHPIPNATDAGALVNIECYRLPLEGITSVDDELEIPEEYHRDLIWWVLYEAYSKQDADGYDKSRGKSYLADFNAAFGPYVDSRVRIHQFEEDRFASITGINYLSNGQNSDPDWPD